MPVLDEWTFDPSEYSRSAIAVDTSKHSGPSRVRGALWLTVQCGWQREGCVLKLAFPSPLPPFHT